jgi:hypothetical protein
MDFLQNHIFVLYCLPNNNNNYALLIGLWMNKLLTDPVLKYLSPDLLCHKNDDEIDMQYLFLN